MLPGELVRTNESRIDRLDGHIDRIACEPPSTILVASMLGMVDVVNALLRDDATCVTRRSISGHSPLFLACDMGHTEVASILIQNIVSDDLGVFGDGALCIAIKNGHEHIIQHFLSSGYNLQRGAEIHGGEHLVWLAVNSGRKDIVAQLLEAGASAHGEGGWDCADTALYTASRNRADLVDLLLRYGADPHTQDGRDGYAIYMAARYANLDAARLLVEYGADVDANNSGDRPYIARFNRYQYKRPLPVSCERTTSSCVVPHSTPLFTAVENDHEKMVTFLLDCGADPVPRFANDRDVFRNAVEEKSSTGTRLLALNMNLDSPDLHTVIAIIGVIGEAETLTRLDLRELDSGSEAVSSALYVAAERNYDSLLLILIEHALARGFGRGVFVSALYQCARHSRTASFKTLWAAACYQDFCPVIEEDWRRDQHVGYGTPCDLYGHKNDDLLSSLIAAASTSLSAEILDILSKARLESTVYHLDRYPEGDKGLARQQWLTETLVKAAGMGRLDEMRLLLDVGADPNGFCHHAREIPLNAAIDGYHEAAVKILLWYGADPSLQVRSPGAYYTVLPLLAASAQPNAYEILETLFEHGATVNARHKQGFEKSDYKLRYQSSNGSIANDHHPSNATLSSSDDRGRSETDASFHDEAISVNDYQKNNAQDECSQDDDCEEDDSETSDTRRDFPGDQTVLAQAVSQALGQYPKSGTPRTRVVALLLENNQDSKIVPRALVPAMYETVRRNTLEFGTLQFLLAHGVDLNCPSGRHASPLSALIELAEGPADLRVIEMLLHGGAKANSGSYQRKSPLQCAVAKPAHSPREQIIDILIAHGADLNARHFEASNALQFACQKRTNERMVTYLLSKGANANVPGGRFGNALQAACYKHCELKVVELLLIRGADVNACGGKWGTALQAACLSRSIRLMRLLHAHNADVNAQGGRFGCALQAACSLKRQDLAVAEYIIQMGADVNLRGGRYGNALICACIMCNDPAVELLLDHAVDVIYVDDVYGSALHAASMAGSTSTVPASAQPRRICRRVR